MALLLEEIFERLPRIQWAAGSGGLDGHLGRLHIGSRRRVFLYRGPKLIKRAVILRVFRRNPCRNRLGALELRSRIEKPALLAAMQLKIALRTFSGRIEACHKHRAAVRTTRSCYCPDHPRRARTEVIGRTSRSALRRFPLPVFFIPFVLLFSITISAVTVLAIHKRLRPSVATDCNYTLPNNCIQSLSFPEMYPIRTLQSPGTPVFPFEVILECQ
jgi:hypothetical protein